MFKFKIVNDIQQSVYMIVAEKSGFSVEKINDELNLKEEIKVDSLTSVELVMALEEKFRIEISDEAMQKVETVGDIIKIVEALVAETRK
ncbi:acyl carrier protein [Candidatus Fokinia solitaria]|uniref:acyl carrier protein n=1 Tax=Candidatus Fokinia solitaria TaxID=1802984 RepID=UPI0011AB7612|nr:acyl carrier protein [Candidatus Fokinia solitaria]